MWLAIVWEIWRHRNNIVFNGGVVDDSEIFFRAQLKAWAWAKFRSKTINYSFSDGCLCPMQCLENT